MSWAADGQDGNGLQLIFSSLSPCVLKTRQSSDYGCFSLLLNSLDLLLLVFYKYFVYDKGN